MDSLSWEILETGNRPVRLYHTRMSDEIWGAGFSLPFAADEWSVMRQKQLPFFFFIYLSFSTPLMRFPAALGPACMNVDRDRHTQGGQQPCLASASSPWQKISMRADNRTRNENNAVCQPRNPPCHSRTFAILGVFHEQSSTRKLNLKFNSSFSALIPDRISLQHLCENWDPEGAAVASRPWLQSQSGWFFCFFFFAWTEPFSFRALAEFHFTLF